MLLHVRHAVGAVAAPCVGPRDFCMVNRVRIPAPGRANLDPLRKGWREAGFASLPDTGSKSGPITISRAAEGFVGSGILGFMGV